MEPVTLTAVATAIKSCIRKSRELIEQLHHKNKLPLLTQATQQNPQQPLDYGKAVLELKAAAVVTQATKLG